MGTQKELNPEQLARVLNLPEEKILWALGKDPHLKRVKAATTLEQAWEAYYEAPSGSEAQKLAREKWQQLSLAQAQAATTLKQAREAYHEASSGSEAQKL
ncbi:hypothetical protein HZA71_02035, partial [Candidatus Falkowbacteria bacterium]|nr:hypothetical protein [Candidatus Falkowbacteria bacterium]